MPSVSPGGELLRRSERPLKWIQTGVLPAEPANISVHRGSEDGTESDKTDEALRDRHAALLPVHAAGIDRLYGLLQWF